MAKADVLALVDTLLLKPDTSGEADIYYDEVLRELGFKEYLTDTRELEVVAGDPDYTIADNTIRVLEMHQGVVGRLDPVSGQVLRAAYGSTWRKRTGTPYHFTRTDESSDSLRLFPIPLFDGTLTAIRTVVPEDVPYWLELAIALEITSRMFLRESAQQDLEMAQTAKQLASIMWILLGDDIRSFARAQTARGEDG